MYCKKAFASFALAGFLLFVNPRLKAQFSILGQLRTRTEIRNGYGNPLPSGSKPAGFTSQRTRFQVLYQNALIGMGASVQDVRVWGQDAATISQTDGSRLMLHEGWAEIRLLKTPDSLSKPSWVQYARLKLGRQELNYDDVRLIGNLDWLQQGRRHDMALLKFGIKKWQVELGQAFNQNADGFMGTSYVPGLVPPNIKNAAGILVAVPAGLVPLTMSGQANAVSTPSGLPVYTNPSGTNAPSQHYKSFTSLHLSRKKNRSIYSFLFFNDRFARYRLDSMELNGAYLYGRRFVKSGSQDDFDYSGTASRMTYGFTINQHLGLISGSSRAGIQAAFYHQTGRDRDYRRLNAWHYSLSATLQLRQISIQPGYDALSGNDGNTRPGYSHRFDPLYGTPHRHWGYMDFFYVATGSPPAGLKDGYLKVKVVSKNEKRSTGLDVHRFHTVHGFPDDRGIQMKKYLGMELDWITTFTLNPYTQVETGLCFYRASPSLQYAKGLSPGPYQKVATWAYLQVNIRPSFFQQKSNP